MPPTPEQVNRGLDLAEGLLSLATDVWNHRKAKPAPRKAKPALKRTARKAKLSK